MPARGFQPGAAVCEGALPLIRDRLSWARPTACAAVHG